MNIGFSTGEPDISVILPVINEQAQVNLSLERLRKSHFSGSLEIIVADGHPDRTTLSAVKDPETVLVSARAGRGNQMNAGAGMARGRILLFLHCDTRLPEKGLDQVLALVDKKGAECGAFDLAIDSRLPIFRLIEKTASLRSRLTRIPYGDQGIFIKRSLFFKSGQFQDIPIMEDVEFMRRLKRQKASLGFIRQPVRTSARRWKKEGVVYATLRNWLLSGLFYLGADPERLVRFYRNH